MANLEREWAKAVVLLGTGFYFAYNILSNRLNNYINTRFVWLSYVAVVVFLVMGSIVLIAALKRRRLSPMLYGDHARQRVTWSMIAVVALPLLLGTLLPAQPLGAEAVQGNISLNVAIIKNATTASKDPAERNILDWLRVFAGTATPSQFNGQEAAFSGFIYREPGFPVDHAMIARFTVSCCVADASAIGLPVYWPGLDDLDQNTWVAVSGTFEAGLFREQRTPILQVAELTPINVPDHPYLYP